MKIFLKSFEATEKCNLNCEHKVTYNQIIEVTEVGKESRDLFYGDIPTGTANVYWYADAEGHIYFKGASWEGPSPYLKSDSDDGSYSTRPHGLEVKKDLDGNVLDIWGEVID